MATNDETLRPELLFGPNPLIEAIPPFIPFGELMRSLLHYPLERIPQWREVPPSSREALLELSTQHFVPYQPILEVAASVQALLRRGLSIANPLMPEVRKRTNQISVASALNDFKHVSHVDGGGGMLSGITGMGKTNAVKRALEIFSPNQVIEHSPSEQAGWARLKQCVYLYIDFPSNGTRGGLLKRIFMALDENLGTDYSDQYNRKTNLDALLVYATKLLVLHRVALLVIDEKQESSFDENPLQYEFVLFYLSLMNLGVSVLVIGNPMAFTHLQTFSQVVRRFSVGGITSLEPAPRQDTELWCKTFVPRMRKFSVVESCEVDESTRAKMEFESSAGIPGLYQPYSVEVQRIALRRSKGSVTAITLDDFVEARKSPRFIGLYKIALSIRLGSNQYDDIPHIKSAEGQDSKPEELSKVTSNSHLNSSKTTTDVVARLLTNFKTAQTKQANLLAKRIEALQTLPDDDLRMLGIGSDLIAQAEKLRATLPGESIKKKKGDTK